MQHWMQQISASETGPNDLYVVGQFQSVSQWFRRFAQIIIVWEITSLLCYLFSNVMLLDTDFCLILRSGLFSIGDCQRVLAIMLSSLVCTTSCTVLVTTFVWHDYFSKCDLARFHENFFSTPLPGCALSVRGEYFLVTQTFQSCRDHQEEARSLWNRSFGII